MIISVAASRVVISTRGAADFFFGYVCDVCHNQIWEMSDGLIHILNECLCDA